MSFDERYTMYALAHHLAYESDFEVLYINAEIDEIWLSKYENKRTTVVRLIQKGFDWKNHLKRDIAVVFQKLKAMKRILRGNHIEVLNVYVSKYEPVDDWDILKKPIELSDKRNITMKVFYLSEDTSSEEVVRFHEIVNVPHEPMQIPAESEKELHANYYQSQLFKKLNSQKNEVKGVYSFGKPFFTYLLIVINIFMFFLLEQHGKSTETDTLIEFGAKYNPLIIDGQWWRIISSMFLHIGILHLFMNMLAIYYLGNLVEKIYGSYRFILIYFLAGIGGGIASFAFSVNVSAGASGAIFGLLGALLYFGLNYKKIFMQTLGTGVLVLVAINVAFGFIVPQVDTAAHIGGLFTGFIGAAVVHLPKKDKNWMRQIMALLFYVFLVYGVALYGISYNETKSQYQLIHIEELLKKEEYEEVIDSATIGIQNKDEYEPLLLFQRSYAYIQLEEVDRAVKDLEKSIALQESSEKIPEAYYNLALLYHDQGDIMAEEMITIATELKPDDKAFQNLYNQIVGNSP